MKVFVSIVGLLTIAQWVFVGLLYGFLHAQEKTTPETMTKLHDFPVIGGYFPKVKIKTQKEKDRMYGDDLREKLLDARRQWNLPASYNDEEFIELLTDIKNRGERLKTETRKLEKLKLEARGMIDEIDRREEGILLSQKQLSQDRRDLDLIKQDVALSKKSNDREAMANERTHSKEYAQWLEGMDPAQAVAKLLAAEENENPEEKNARYRRVAQTLSLMDKEAAAKVIELIKPLDWVYIEEAKRALPVTKK